MVMEVDASTPSHRHLNSNAAIVVTRGLLDTLNRDELQA